MPWITNVSYKDIVQGKHRKTNKNTMLIQIVDPDMDFPEPKQEFYKEVFQFYFLDLEAADWPELGDAKCTPDTADKLAAALRYALALNMNVMVHCVAGVSRSGAVVEVGGMLGFEVDSPYRAPNLLVKHLMLQALNMPYDPYEDVYAVENGVVIYPYMYGAQSG